jgi:hypothetical protein
MTRKLILVLLALTLLAACAPAEPNDSAVATLVAVALQTSAAQDTVADQPAATQQPLYGIASGDICFPSSGIPPMVMFFQQDGTNTFTSVDIAQNQSSYEQELLPGNYIAYAWLPDFSIGGSYSQAVTCGLTVDCTDHSLISFSIVAGQTTGGVDVCDWYGDSDDVPLPPGYEGDFAIGSITGELSYPSEGIPSMDVVAINAETNDWFYVITNPGDNSYQIDNIPAGFYYVLAYPNLDGIGAVGGYSAAVLCGLSVDCMDHSLVQVEVLGWQISVGANPQDWYAPEGTYPPNPVP